MTSANTPWKIFLWNVYQNIIILIRENAFEYAISKMSAILC